MGPAAGSGRALVGPPVREGRLALPRIEADNWSSSATGGDVLRSAYNLLFDENPLGSGTQGHVPSAEHVSEVQAYDLGNQPVLIGRGCLERVRDGTAAGVRAIRWPLEQDDAWPILVYDDTDAQGEERPLGPDPRLGREEVPVYIAKGAPLASTPATRLELGELLGLNFGGGNALGSVLVLAVSESGVVPYHSFGADSVYVRKLVQLRDDAGTRSGRDASVPSKSVAIVGAGSVGSKIAETLLRAGGTSLFLFDGDVLLPGNLERHTLDWRDVGSRKVYALKRRLLNIRPGATVHTFAENFNWQRSAVRQAALVDVLASCDLIVDATGDVPTSLFLGAIAAENGKPFVSVEVLAGGIGCIIARSVPGRDAAYPQGRAGLMAYCEQQAVAPPAGGTRAYESITDEGAVVVADDAAVSAAAAHAARVAMDVMQGTLDDDAPAWLLIGLRRSWIFHWHGHVIGLHAPPALDGTEQEPTMRPEREERARDLILSLLKEEAGETAAPEC